jgi:flavin-binding protein dodecin
MWCYISIINADSTVRKEISAMTTSVYKFIELVGTSTESWEKAVAAAIAAAAKTVRDLRIAEVSELDVQLDDGKIVNYRAKVKLSFKVEIDAT